MIPFNKPFIIGNEIDYIKDSINSGKISGDGKYSKKVHTFFEEKFGFRKCLLTTSCTDALEMIAILLEIKKGDEVIMPAFTFVSTANAFVLRGAKVIFCDSSPIHPGIDENKIEKLISKKTKAVVIVHYAGVSCNMMKIKSICDKYRLYLVEDAAQAVDAYYLEKGKLAPLGSFGDLSAFSFHETKNIISGEGGLLIINNERFIKRAEIIREKGTNRTQFFRGEIDKYGWVDIGSSYLPSDIIAAFLYAQLENLKLIKEKRRQLWERYFQKILRYSTNFGIQLPQIPNYSLHNYYFLYNSKRFKNKGRINCRI